MRTEKKHQRQSPTEMAHLPELPLLGLHQAIEQAGAYQFLVPRRHVILKAYLTTEVPMGDLKPLAGVKTRGAVLKLIHRSMQQVFPYLPLEVRAEYKSPQEAIRRKAGKLSSISRERLKTTLAEQVDPQTGRIEFKAPHKNNLSEAASRRWQRVREQKAQAQAASTTEQP